MSKLSVSFSLCAMSDDDNETFASHVKRDIRASGWDRLPFRAQLAELSNKRAAILVDVEHVLSGRTLAFARTRNMTSQQIRQETDDTIAEEYESIRSENLDEEEEKSCEEEKTAFF